MTFEEAHENLKLIAEYARSLGFRGVIVAGNVGDADSTWWRAEYRGPAFDVECLARRLHNFTARIVRYTEMQTDVLPDHAQRQQAVPLDTVGGAGAQSEGSQPPPQATTDGASP